jgi:hypothetical protein
MILGQMDGPSQGLSHATVDAGLFGLSTGAQIVPVDRSRWGGHQDAWWPARRTNMKVCLSLRSRVYKSARSVWLSAECVRSGADRGRDRGPWVFLSYVAFL